MSAARSLKLLDWAHKTSAWILEDDYDSEYRYQTMPIASLQGLDHGSRVIYIGTFSKTLFPALRLGYIVVPSDLVDHFAPARRATDICPPDLYQSVLTDFLEQGHFARHIRKTKLIYNERRSVLIEALDAEFGARRNPRIRSRDAPRFVARAGPERSRNRLTSGRTEAVALASF